MTALTLLWRLLWPPHEHAWTLEVRPQTGYFGHCYAHRLVWTCQTCPHREYLGLAWPDASNRTAA